MNRQIKNSNWRFYLVKYIFRAKQNFLKIRELLTTSCVLNKLSQSLRLDLQDSLIINTNIVRYSHSGAQFSGFILSI